MPLIDIELPFELISPPSDASELIETAHDRIDLFLDRHRNCPVPGFVASDFEMVYSALKAVITAHLAPGRCFCEWGSGFGVVASLAAMLNLDAFGIEIESELVREASCLANDFQIDVDFAAG